MKLRYIPIAVFLLLAVAFALNHAYWAYRVSVEFDHLRNLGYPTNLAEFSEWYRLPAGEANANELYDRAFSVLDREGIDFNRITCSGYAELDPARPLPPDVFRETRNWIEANQTCFELLVCAARTPHARIDIDSAQPQWQFFRELLSERRFTDFRAARRFIEDAQLYYRDCGDVDALILAIEAGLGLGPARAQMEDAILGMSSLSTERFLLMHIALMLGSPDLTEADYAALDTIFARASAAWNQDVYVSSMVVLPMRTRGDKPTDYFRLTWMDDPFTRRLGFGMLLGEGKVDIYEAARFARWYFSTPNVLDPDHRFPPVPSEASGRIPPIISSVHYATKEINTTRELVTRLKLLRIATSVERHRLRHGSLPTALSEIDYDTLEVNLTDPFSGEPLLFAVYGAGYTLWSVGLNGIDDGGVDPATGFDARDDVAIQVERSGEGE